MPGRLGGPKLGGLDRFDGGQNFHTISSYVANIIQGRGTQCLEYLITY